MIYLYNPHVDDLLGEPPHFKYLGRRPLKKYGFFAGPVTDEEIAEAKGRSKSDSGGSSLDDAWNRIHERNQTNP